MTEALRRRRGLYQPTILGRTEGCALGFQSSGRLPLHSKPREPVDRRIWPATLTLRMAGADPGQPRWGRWLASHKAHPMVLNVLP